MQRKRNQAKQIEAQTQVYRILQPGTPCHQRRPETRPEEDKGCARKAETGQHQSSQTILWIRQLLSKVYAETKWSLLETSLAKRMSQNGPMNMMQLSNESKKWQPHHHFSSTTTRKTN